MFPFSRDPPFSPTTSLLDLTGKVIIVTGGNKGIGLTTVKFLARKGAKVYLGSRSEENAETAIAKLKAEGIIPGEVLFLPCDLSTPQSAKNTGEEFLKREDRLDVLVNNAAMTDVSNSVDNRPEGGITQHMMTNHIGTFVLTQTLLPLLIKTSQEPNSDVRIVTVASGGHKLARGTDPGLRFNTVDSLKERYLNDKFGGFSRYVVSKLANIIFSSQLQTILSSQPESANITCISVHPGAVDTFSHRLPVPWLTGFIVGLFFKDPDTGSYTTSFAAAGIKVSENKEKYKGKYLEPIAQIATPGKNAQRKDLAEELWNTTIEYLRSIGLLFS